MAELVSYLIPNLIQGVSQQSDAQRDPSQGEIQINAMSSAAEGLRKREGSVCIAKVSTSSFGDSAEVFFHQIQRSADEQYLVVITAAAIRVFNLAGEEKTVNAVAGPYNPYTYLSGTTSIRADIRASSIADYTFISNTKKIPAMTAALAPAVARPAAHEALVWVKAANYGQRYVLNVNNQQVTVATAVAPVVVSGASTIENRISTAEIASQLRGGLVGGPALALTLTASATTLNATNNNLATTTDEGGSGLTVNVTGDGTAITAVAIGNAAGNAYRVGDKVFVARSLLQGGTDTTPVQVATVTTATAGPLTGVTIARNGSVLHLTSSSAITIAASDARANADITAITNSVQAFTELPTIAPQGYQVEIVGDPGNKFDGYYVKFVPRSGTFGEGSWEETVSPGVQYSIDSTTMPHLLVRLPNDTFWFGPANGSTQTGVKIPAWGERSAGDYDTAPDPSFIGYPIQDIFIYKNRLGILADENIILSRARDFFEFFPETVTAVLDSDPIDLAASNTRVSILRYAVPYQDELIIFSDQVQFRFNAAETVLTPATAQITVLTSYEIDTRCRPIPVQGSIMFCQTNGQWSLFREFSVRGVGTAIVADASDVTSNVTSYIPEEVYKIAANDTGNTVFVLPGKPGYKKRIYVYKYWFRDTSGVLTRVQSSWSYWELNGANEILSMLCIDETLYILARYSSEVWLEKISVTDRLSDASPNPYPLLLDRVVSTTSATPAAIRVSSGTYNSGSNTTTWTLPYTIRATTQAWSDWASAQGVQKIGEATTGTTITATGDWRSAPIYFGEAFTFRYQFTRFKVYREISGAKVAVNVTRSQIRYVKLRHHGTPYFRALVTVYPRGTSTYVYQGSIFNGPSINEDTFRIPISSRGDNCVVELLNDTAHPCKFASCEWVGLLTGQARSSQQ